MAKKKILLLSDDLRMSSGVGTMSKEFVLGTLHKYDWAQIGGAIKHPENGKRVDMNQVAREETGVEDATLTIYPTDGYGNPDSLRQIMSLEKPDAILHYTDPRFWRWLYDMENPFEKINSYDNLDITMKPYSFLDNEEMLDAFNDIYDAAFIKDTDMEKSVIYENIDCYIMLI